MSKRGITKFTAIILTAGLVVCDGGIGAWAATTDTPLVGVGSTTHVKSSAAETEAPAEQQTEARESSSVASAAGADTALVGIASTVRGKSTGESAPAETETEEETAAETVVAEDTGAEETAAAQEGAEDTESEETAAAAQETQAAETAEETEEETETETETELDTSMVGTTGFAQCNAYLNVRSEAYIESDTVGKIYNNGSVEILGVDENGWYHIRSGNVEGYVAAEYIATGEQAESIADEVGYTTAEVGAEVLNVRADSSTDSDIIATLTDMDTVEVVADEGEWVKVCLDADTYGYVSTDYVYTSTAYATGETLEEEQERLDAQWLEYLAESEAAAAAEQAAAAAQAAATAQAQADEAQAAAAAAQAQAQAAAAEAQAQAEAAAAAQAAASQSSSGSASDLYQVYLTAQQAADDAVATGADEQTIIDTCAAAQDAYAVYVAAQNEADAAAIAAAQAEADAAAQAQAEAEAAAAQAQAQAEAAAAAAQSEADAAAAAQAQAESEAAAAAAAQAEADAAAAAQYEEETTAQEETAAQTTSSLGQQIASYACQFVGNPYVYGGSSLTGGADCSGFTMSVFAQFGISLPHNAAAQSGYGTAVDLSSLQPGDLLFYSDGSGIGHVTIYIGNGQVVHASNSTNGIIISSYSYRTPVCARRLV